jgi:hypothetical protein
MGMTFRVPLAVICLSIASLQCLAQASKVSSDDVMDAAFDMKKASEAADKLAGDGSKYCKWGTSSMDTSDLDVAISRFLLNRGSQVPENISASKMWHVSIVAGDLVHQLAMGSLGCDLRLRLSEDNRRVALAVSSTLLHFMLARTRFNDLAYRQTIWQEQNSEEAKTPEPQEPKKVPADRILIAAREMKDAAEAASSRLAASETTPACLHTSSPSKATDLAELTKLIDYMTHQSHSDSTIPAANMWGVGREADAAQIDVIGILGACAPYAGEKKAAGKIVAESIPVYHRLSEAIATFDALALRQTEWEEQTSVQSQHVLKEQ